MPMSDADRELIRAFRLRAEAKLSGQDGFGQANSFDREDESLLATRFEVGEKLWIELCVRPFIPLIRAGIVTDDRWKNEDLEQAIEDSGDTMSEFIEFGFEEVGLTWPSPTVEHFREQGKYFYFATSLELAGLAALRDQAVFDKAIGMCRGYFESFRPAIAKSAAGD